MTIRVQHTSWPYCARCVRWLTAPRVLLATTMTNLLLYPGSGGFDLGSSVHAFTPIGTSTKSIERRLRTAGICQRGFQKADRRIALGSPRRHGFFGRTRGPHFISHRRTAETITKMPAKYMTYPNGGAVLPARRISRVSGP